MLQLVRSILERVEAGSEVLASDLAHIRMFFAEEGFIARVLGMFGGPKPPRRRRTRKDEAVD